MEGLGILGSRLEGSRKLGVTVPGVPWGQGLGFRV